MQEKVLIRGGFHVRKESVIGAIIQCNVMIPLESRTSSAPLSMKELREQLVFHDHLLAAVTHWKNQIIAELKSDQNIIFIGVHCRNEKQTT